MTRLAIIGTAGRKDDGHRLTAASYARMVGAVGKFLTRRQIDPTVLEVVSGGAAWADHLAVTLVVEGLIPASALTLYLPAELTSGGYVGHNEWAEKTAGTANYYHRRFSQVIGTESIAQLNAVIAQGANNEVVRNGFKARNSKVAGFLGSEDELLAFTFGDPSSDQPDWSCRRFEATVLAAEAGLKDGGTADTWNKARCWKNHARIGTLI